VEFVGFQLDSGKFFIGDLTPNRVLAIIAVLISGLTERLGAKMVGW
jgi:hypothetical protein